MSALLIGLSALFQSTLLAGGATIVPAVVYSVYLFQSTLLAGGATNDSVLSDLHVRHFNPRSSREERRFAIIKAARKPEFQSTLLAGGATCNSRFMMSAQLFQSTLLAGGATRDFADFSPSHRFQSTLLAGGATSCSNQLKRHRLISIHAPRGRSDRRNYRVYA